LEYGSTARHGVNPYEDISVVVRWREAVCMMMLMQDPHITTEGVARLGRHLAQIFRQDLQVKFSSPPSVRNVNKLPIDFLIKFIFKACQI
jgi:hypothetical protein